MTTAHNAQLGQCPCGTGGTVTQVSPTVLEGGNTRDNVYEVTNEKGSHLFKSEFTIREGYVITCLRQTTT
jgi:hypothetical protein